MLPVLLVACQYVSTAIITPKKDPKEKEEENATAQVRFWGFFEDSRMRFAMALRHQLQAVRRDANRTH